MKTIKNFASFGLFGEEGFIKSGCIEDMIEEAKMYIDKGIMKRVTISTVAFDDKGCVVEGTIILIITIICDDILIVNNLI